MIISKFCKYAITFPREFVQHTFNSNEFCRGSKFFNIRKFSVEKLKLNGDENRKKRSKTIRNFTTAVGVATLAGAYAAVPLYRIFCQASGYGGAVKADLSGEKVEAMKAKTYRKVAVKFTSDVSTQLQWKFRPQQQEIVVSPGETALAFYTAENPLDEPVIGISTYNVLPFEAAVHFNKIQCFCFEEQQLNPKEQVDMPVFFYIDPEFCEDPRMENVNEIILSYTFFRAKKGMDFSKFLGFGKKTE